MTVLSKSKIKVKDGKRLYYNKFSYKVHLKANQLYWAYWVDDLNEFRIKIDERVKEEEEVKRFFYGKKTDPNNIDYAVIEKYLAFKNKYKLNRNTVLQRREGDGVCIYSNEVDIINEVLDFSPSAEVTQIVPMPSGVILFKQDPPAAYRVFLKTLTKPGSIRQELIDYLERTPDMVPNSTLERALGQRWPNVYFHAGHYLNYNDDRNILMMHLMFPGILGKSYKLEKK